VIAGLGTGWSVDEYAATAPRPMRERGAALKEFLDIAEAVWRPDPVSFNNERYHIFPAEIGPKPTRRIPVLLGGWSQKTLDRIARRAAGLLPSMTPPDQIRASMTELRERAEEYGRDPAELSCTTVVALFSLAEVPERGRQPYTAAFRRSSRIWPPSPRPASTRSSSPCRSSPGPRRSWPISPPRSASRSSKQASDGLRGHHPVRALTGRQRRTDRCHRS
jgi:alkanesulfonate monooxygenase SsuD/methylene tetrahydromethanopterin reductase-like flavin-dependent oxidoreductase (luciferase family)